MTRIAAVLLAAMSVACPGAQAQAFPTQPIRIVVPFPPGGIDTVARLLAETMSRELGQPVVVENRPGANGMVGTVHVVQSRPDGHTLVFTTASTLVSGVLLMKHASIDPVRDFTPISLIYAGSQVFAVHKSVPARSFGEFVEYARKNPRKLYYSTSGVGSNFHLIIEAMKDIGGFDIVHVPYKGTGPAAAALFSGEVQVGLPSMNSMGPFVEDGTIVPLAVLREKRHARMDKLPMVKEVLPGFQRPPGWIGMFGPAGLSAPVVRRLNATVVKGSHMPKVLAYLENGGNELLASSAEDAAAQIKADMVIAGRMIEAVGIKKQ